MARIDSSAFAILQTVVLILAVLAGATTVLDPASAAAQDLTITNEGQELRPNGNLTFEVTNDVSVEEQTIHVWIDANANGVFDTDERNRSLHPDGGETVNGTFPDVSLAPGTYTLMAVENDSLSDGREPDTTDNFTVDNTPPSISEAVAFTETAGTQAYGAVNQTVVEVLFNESLSDGSGGTAPEQGDFCIKYTNGTIDKNVTVADGDTGDVAGDRRIVLYPGSEVIPPDVKGVATAPEAGFSDAAGNPVTRHAQAVKAASTTVAEGGGNTTAFEGEHVAIVGDEDDENIDLRGSDAGTIKDVTTGTDSRVFAWHSAGWSTTQRYYVLFDGRSNPNFLIWDDVSFELNQLGLEVEPSKRRFSTTEAVTAIVTAEVANRTITATLLDPNDSEVLSKSVTLTETDARVDFGQQSTGDYSIAVEDNATGLRADAGPIRVEDPAPTRTPTATPTLTATPTPIVLGPPTVTVTGTPALTGTPTASTVQTPAETPYPIVTPPEHLTPTPTPTPAPSPTVRPQTGATPAAPDEPPEGVGEILGLMWEGASDTVTAVFDIISDTVSGLLP